jgi:hypothetical protein
MRAFVLTFVLALLAPLLVASVPVAAAQISSSEVFGDVNYDLPGYGTGETVASDSLDARPAEFGDGGVGTINRVIYNIKDYVKYIAGSLAILWLMVSAFTLVTADDDEAITHAKGGIQWALTGLILVFTIDVVIITFFEGGLQGTPGQNLVDGVETNANLLASIGEYFSMQIGVLFQYLKILISALAVAVITYAGFRMVTAGGNEEEINNQKSYLINAVIALLTVSMLDLLIFNVIYPIGTLDPTTSEVINMNADCLSYLQGDLRVVSAGCENAAAMQGFTGHSYIIGVVRFLQSLVGGAAVFYIILSGVRIIASFGNPEEIASHKKGLLYSIIGLVVVLLSKNFMYFFLTDFTTGEITANYWQGLIDLAGITNFLLTFVAIASFVVLLFAGVTWVASFGNEEQVGHAKKMVFGALVGIVISLSAYAVVSSLTAGDPSGGGGASVSVSVGI